jgi:hypothetical protein
MNRKEGYYWVKFKGGWEVGLWTGGYWLLTDSLRAFEDSKFDEINETQILPPNN